VTTAKSIEIERRRGAPRKPRTMAGALAAHLLGMSSELVDIDDEDDIKWPSPRYARDPVAYFREVLGAEPWRRQIDVIEAVRDHKRVAVASGHKVSKSHTAAGIALWFYCSYDQARVVMTSATSRQVDQILWRELRMMLARAKREIHGELHELARSGFKAPDFREIVGFTAREAEAVAGVSGKNVLYLIDEASGVEDPIFEAIEGNRAGGARIVMFSNPTRTEGEFAAAFFSKSKFYKTLRISSEESPNVIEGREVIPGLATREWIDEKREEWGEDSALYKVRVRGEFVTREDGKILTLHAISTAEMRWHDAPWTGPLFIGIDPAGPGGAGDESVFAVRRGQKVIALYGLRGLTEEAHLVHLLAILQKHLLPVDLRPVVVVDREGSVGARVWSLLLSHAGASEEGAAPFDLYGVRSSDKAMRQPFIYDRIRDELWANLELWMRAGGGIPTDARLAKELHAPSFVSAINGKLKATPKDELRKILGHSPDRADAVALSVWEPGAARQYIPDNARETAPEQEQEIGAHPLDSLNWTRKT
jgi:phage terminase large subunit